MTKTTQAPTKKVENNIENGLFVDLSGGVTLCATEVLPYHFEQTGQYTGETTIEVFTGGYSITSHNGRMPKFHEDTFDSLQALANAMRDYADLRTWRRIDHS